MGTLFPTLVYTLCFATSALCAYLLGRSFGRTRSRLLFWSALCFVGLSINNLLLFFDFVVFPTQVDLRPWRLAAALAGLLFLLYAFIWEAE
jgi:hypothetical protein